MSYEISDEMAMEACRSPGPSSGCGEGILLYLLQIGRWLSLVPGFVEWNPGCMEVCGASVVDVGLWKYQPGSLKMGYTAASQVPTIEAVFPPKIEAHWETDNRLVWNEMEGAAEEQELIYEVTWIPEIGAWRRFLKSRRNVHR
jgi:hypothetical protein